MASYRKETFVSLSSLNTAQRATFGAVGVLLQGAPGNDGLNLLHITVADGVPTPMPADVFTIQTRPTDGRSAQEVFLHPDGSLRLNYSPAARPIDAVVEQLS